MTNNDWFLVITGSYPKIGTIAGCFSCGTHIFKVRFVIFLEEMLAKTLVSSAEKGAS